MCLLLIGCINLSHSNKLSFYVNNTTSFLDDVIWFFSLTLFCGLKFFYTEPVIFITIVSYFDSKAEYEIALVLQLQCMYTDKD